MRTRWRREGFCRTHARGIGRSPQPGEVFRSQVRGHAVKAAWQAWGCMGKWEVQRRRQVSQGCAPSNLLLACTAHVVEIRQILYSSCGAFRLGEWVDAEIVDGEAFGFVRGS